MVYTGAATAVGDKTERSKWAGEISIAEFRVSQPHMGLSENG